MDNNKHQTRRAYGTLRTCTVIPASSPVGSVLMNTSTVTKGYRHLRMLSRSTKSVWCVIIRRFTRFRPVGLVQHIVTHKPRGVRRHNVTSQSKYLSQLRRTSA